MSSHKVAMYWVPYVAVKKAQVKRLDVMNVRVLRRWMCRVTKLERRSTGIMMKV